MSVIGTSEVARANWDLVCAVGTFGVTAASYWSRVAWPGLELRRHCVAGHSIWRALQTTRGTCLGQTRTIWKREDFSIMFLNCYCVCFSGGICGVSESWNKKTGGDAVSWVGFELLHQSFELGISQRRADWFTRWTREVADPYDFHASEFENDSGASCTWLPRLNTNVLSWDRSTRWVTVRPSECPKLFFFKNFGVITQMIATPALLPAQVNKFSMLIGKANTQRAPSHCRMAIHEIDPVCACRADAVVA